MAALLVNRTCDRPVLIEALRNKEVVNIACGGSHSAAITVHGELFTWGKGRYGRLGHGDTEDRHVPKLVSGNLDINIASEESYCRAVDVHNQLFVAL